LSDTTEITLDLLLSVRPEHVKHEGGSYVSIGKETPVTYNVVGWNAKTNALVLEKTA
jgi:hypothetical protein